MSYPRIPFDEADPQDKDPLGTWEASRHGDSTEADTAPEPDDEDDEDSDDL